MRDWRQLDSDKKEGPPTFNVGLRLFFNRLRGIAFLFLLAAGLVLISFFDDPNRDAWRLTAIVPAVVGLLLFAGSLSRLRSNDDLLGGLEVRHNFSTDPFAKNRSRPFGSKVASGPIVRQKRWEGNLEDLPPEMRERLQSMIEEARDDPSGGPIRVVNHTTTHVYNSPDKIPQEIRAEMEEFLRKNPPGGS